MQAQVVQLLNTAEIKFTMVCPFHIELHPTARDCGDVLVIAVLPGSLRDPARAEEVVRQIVLVLQSFNLHSAGVEICEAETGFYALPKRFLPGHGISFDDTYAGPLPIIGTSVGAASSDTTGTLGPFLGLVFGGDVNKFKVIVLTASHVLNPEDEHASTNPQIDVVSPSDPDHATWMEALGDGLPNVGSTSDTTVENHDNPFGLTTRLQDLLADPGYDQHRLQQARDQDRRIGPVLIISGTTEKCTIKHCRLDWAAVDVTSALESIGPGCVIPTNIPPPPLVDYLRQIGFDAAEAKARKAVFKLGRTSGPTVGVYHGCKPVIRQYRSKVVESQEEVVVPAANEIPFFTREGDSGALVYGPEGEGRGMVWGGVSAAVQTTLAIERIVFVTPIQAIARDVVARFEQAYPDGKVSWHWLA